MEEIEYPLSTYHLFVLLTMVNSSSANEFFDAFIQACERGGNRTMGLAFWKEAKEWCADDSHKDVKDALTDVNRLRAAVQPLFLSKDIFKAPVGVQCPFGDAIVRHLRTALGMPQPRAPLQIVDDRLATLERENAQLRQHLQRLEVTIEGLMRCRDVDAGKVDYHGEAGVNKPAVANE